MVDVVIDTVVFVRSLINPHSLWGELVFRRRGHYRLIVSPRIVEEIGDVLRRPEITKKFRNAEVFGRAAIDDLIAQAVSVEPVELDWTGRDPKDDVFIATAIAAGARYLISEDRDLLDLGSVQGVEIVDAATFLRLTPA